MTNDSGGDKDKPPEDTASIQYQGRPAQRADSRERRRAILEATLRIIARDGTRGVRHRAVAKEADVPLSATTYYFKDISDLISDAFALFAEDSVAGTRELKTNGFAILEKYSTEQLQAEPLRERLSLAITHFVVEHIVSQVSSRDMRVLEYALLGEAVRNDSLAVATDLAQREIREAVIEFFTRFGSSDPEADALIVMGVIQYLELLTLTRGGLPDRELLTRTVERAVRQSLALPLYN